MKPDAQNQFPSSVVLLAALILMAGHGCSGKSGVSPSGPRMEFEKTEIDLGRLEEGEVGNARFGFENMGKGLLKIDKVSTSCGCTSATSTVAAIGPGQKSFVDLALNTLGKQGAVTVSAKVKSNDQAHPEMELLLKGNVFTPLEWQPKLLDFGKLLPGTAAARTVTVKWLKVDKALKVNVVKVEPSGILLSPVREQQGKEGAEFVFDVSLNDVA